MKKYSLYLFAAVSIGELLAQAMNWPSLHHMTKPMLMIFLGGHYIFTCQSNGTPVSGKILLALFFSWLGDVLLMGQAQQLFFMLGLAAFLISHLFYISTYRAFQLDSDAGLLPTQKARFSFPIILWGTGLIVMLYDRLGDLKIPVIIYAVVLMVMVMQALFRYGKTSSASFWSVLAGAILFLLSDSLIALQKFSSPMSYGPLYIMCTYILAQYLIVRGLLRHGGDHRA